jgi:hypothetical protein
MKTSEAINIAPIAGKITDIMELTDLLWTDKYWK